MSGSQGCWITRALESWVESSDLLISLECVNVVVTYLLTTVALMLPYRTDAVALSYIKTKGEGDSSLTLGCVWLFF